MDNEKLKMALRPNEVNQYRHQILKIDENRSIRGHLINELSGIRGTARNLRLP